MAAKATPPTGPAGAGDGQTARRLRVQLDERNLEATYANAFRTSFTPEEVVLDFGFNLQNAPAAADSGQPDVTFVIHSRIVLNYFSAKRLALALGQNLRRHEEQFGDLELDPEKRKRKPR